MTVRFSVTIDLHGVPTERHIRDIEGIGFCLAVRRLCCQRDDRMRIESQFSCVAGVRVAGVRSRPAGKRRPVASESMSSSEMPGVAWNNAKENVA